MASTATTPTTRYTYTPRPIPPAALAELRHADDHGRPLQPFTADPSGVPFDAVGSPLRCCLRPVEPGERVALVSYAPLRRWAAATGAQPGAYDEAGPVFIHAEPCSGPPRSSTGYPLVRPGALRVVRRYDARGHIAGGSLLELPATTEAAQQALTRAFTDAFADPAVTLLHVRAVEYGCFHYELRRPPEQ